MIILRSYNLYVHRSLQLTILLSDIQLSIKLAFTLNEDLTPDFSIFYITHLMFYLLLEIAYYFFFKVG